jgi:hypothetical protein
MQNLKFFGSVTLIVLAACLASPRPAHAQTTRNAEYCTDVYTSGSGDTTIHNSCPYQIHYYWIPVNDPNKHYNSYLDPGRSDSFRPNGQFRWYACDAAYYVVGPDRRVIDHLVDSYSCKKK